jgi:phage-related protein
MKRIEWQGTSYQDLLDFPLDARRDAGYQLHKVQRGDEPSDWKPMKTIGAGVKEIRIQEASGVFRVIYVANINDRVYVLHAFQIPEDQHSRLGAGQETLQGHPEVTYE